MQCEALWHIRMTLESYSKQAKSTGFIALRLSIGNYTPDEAMGVLNNGSWKKVHRLLLMSCFSSESIKMFLVANNKVSETIRNCAVIRGRKCRVGWDSEWVEPCGRFNSSLGFSGSKFSSSLHYSGLVWFYSQTGCDMKTSVTSTHGVKGKKRNLPREGKKSFSERLGVISFVFY